MPEPTMNPRLDVLLSRAADEAATAEEWRELEALLAADPAARRRYVQMMDLHVELRVRHAKAISPDEAQCLATSRSRFAWLSWRPLTAAAAGLVIGLFSASMVWAFATPRAEWVRKALDLVNGGFESEDGGVRRGFPDRAGVWAGDEAAAVSETEGVRPVEGLRMMKLEPVRTGARQFSYLHQIVDVGAAREQARQVELSVSFHAADAGTAQRFALRVAGFAEAPELVRPLWRDALEAATAATQRAVTVPAGKGGWQTLTVRLDLPPGTRSLVIALGARSLDAATPLQPHFVDDVKATLLIPKTSLP